MKVDVKLDEAMDAFEAAVREHERLKASAGEGHYLTEEAEQEVHRLRREVFRAATP